MKTSKAIHLAGSREALAEILGCTARATRNWGDELPEARMFQLKGKKPEWFAARPRKSKKKSK